MNLFISLNLWENYDNKPYSHTHFLLQRHARGGKLEFWDDVKLVACRTTVDNLTNSYNLTASQLICSSKK